MAIYAFRDTRTGKHVEIELPMGKAPGFGEKYRGRYERVVCAPGAGSAGGRVRHTAYNLPTHIPGAPRYDAQGFAQFQSRREIAEFEAKNPTYRFEGE